MLGWDPIITIYCEYINRYLHPDRMRLKPRQVDKTPTWPFYTSGCICPRCHEINGRWACWEGVKKKREEGEERSWCTQWDMWNDYGEWLEGEYARERVMD